MKKALTILTGILIAFSSYSQNSNTFSKVNYYFGDSTTNASHIKSIVKIDSGYLIGVTGEYDSTYYDLFIIKTDPNGNILDMYHKTDPNSHYMLNYGKSIIIDQDSNIIVCGSEYIKQPLFRWIGYAIKLNPSLDTLWTTRILYPDTLPGCTGNAPCMMFKAIHETPDGGYIIPGKYYYDCVADINSARTFLIKLDAGGNEEWRRMYMDKKYTYSIDVTNDGGYVFPDFKSQWRITKTDSLGNDSWVTQPNDSVHMIASDLALKDNYVIAVSPFRYNNTDNPYDMKYGLDIVKIDEATGQIIWNKQYRTFDSFHCVTLHQAMEVVLTDNDDIVIAGSVIDQYINGQYYSNRGILFRLNSQGDSLWCRLYDVRRDQDMSQFNDVVITDDGGFLAAGFFKPYDHSYAVGGLLVKTDSMGMAPNTLTLNIQYYLEKQSKNIKVYPNTAENTITFDAGKIASFKEVLLTIYDSKGQKLSQLHLNSAVSKIDIKKYKSGVYFYRLQSNGKEYTGKFMKV